MPSSIAIIGSRDYPALSHVTKFVMLLPIDSIVVSGGARGPDKIGETTAIKRGLKTEIYLSDWDKFGKAAGMIRNSLIVKNSDWIVAFWDGLSRGTLNSIETAKSLNLPITIFNSGDDSISHFNNAESLFDSILNKKTK